MVQISTGRARTRKREILLAASEVFRRRGFHAAGMREIAAEAGMTVGNLYYYFSSKEALLAFCQEDTLDGLLALAGRISELDLQAEQKLYLLVLGHVLWLNEEIPGSLAHLEVDALQGRLRSRLLRKRDRYEAAWRGLLDEGCRGRRFRPVDPKVTAFAMLGAVNWTVRWFRPDGERSAEEVGRAFAETMVRGVLAPGVRLRAPEPALLRPEEVAAS